MPGGDDVPLSDRGAIIARSNEGLSQRAIGKKLGYARSTVGELKKVREESKISKCIFWAFSGQK